MIYMKNMAKLNDSRVINDGPYQILFERLRKLYCLAFLVHILIQGSTIWLEHFLLISAVQMPILLVFCSTDLS